MACQTTCLYLNMNNVDKCSQYRMIQSYIFDLASRNQRQKTRSQAENINVQNFYCWKM